MITRRQRTLFSGIVMAALMVLTIGWLAVAPSLLRAG